MIELAHRDSLSPKVDRSIRPEVRGKFLFSGGEKLLVRGVTYGTFRPRGPSGECYVPAVVERDFAAIAAAGMNAVRTYTVPPLWFLDAAQRQGLLIMVGLPWEQHVTFLDQPRRAQDIEGRVRAGVRACAGHPAVLCYAIGNEIPAAIVRWYGPRRVESFLERLYWAAKAEDPAGLVTYVNYPTTEYLSVPFVDFLCFNVYLESQQGLEAYLCRLHNLASDRPLIMAEIGLDSRRNGEALQAEVLKWQVRSTFASGCAGAFVFAWTDEWYRGGYDIEDWDFGLTDRWRRPKPALAAVARSFSEVPFPAHRSWPSASVVVCTFNGARTIRDTLHGLAKLEYPNYEVIVVDDGSPTDDIARIVGEYKQVQLIRTDNRGLSSARNTGLATATGDIIAYIDDDAAPDPHWLTYLADALVRSDHVGVGGPNLPVPDDGPVADCVAHAPGGPTHVLLSDREAEHVPGCNMAFLKTALLAIGGFDPQFRAAGDDVDLCWRLQERGWKLGFSPAAVVWHHRRSSVGAYWRQQVGYGKAEAMLERKWPEKYNAAGHLAWAGRIYASHLMQRISWGGSRIYYGTWGTAPFQSRLHRGPSFLRSLAMMPEWYLVVLLLAGLSALGALWKPLLFALPLFALAAGGSIVHAVTSAAEMTFPSAPRSFSSRLARSALTAVLHLLQPLARLCGRVREGLTPWRSQTGSPAVFPRARSIAIWSETWRSHEAWLHAMERELGAQRAVLRRGGNFDGWDLEIRGGLLGRSRLLTAIEEHGAGRQLVRVRAWPRVPGLAAGLALLFTVLAAVALLDRYEVGSALLGAAALALVLRLSHECGAAVASALASAEALRVSVADRHPSPHLARDLAAVVMAPADIPIELEPARADPVGPGSR
jgi:O-antigen biosynthesis protein